MPQLFDVMIFQRGMRDGGRERQGWGREGGMHIQWSHDLLADKPSIALQRKHNEHSIEELTSHVKPLPVWLKGKKEGLYLLMIGGRTKLILCWTGMAGRRTFLLQILLVVHEKMSMFDPMFGWKDTVAYPGRGQWAQEKSISDTEMYSGIQA